MAIKHYSVAVTTDASGDGTAYSPHFTGRICSISYAKTDFANGVDFAVTVEGTGEGVWTESNVNASTTRNPRAATHGVDGAAALYAAAGTGVLDRISVARDRVKVVVAQGGNVKSGTFNIVVES